MFAKSTNCLIIAFAACVVATPSPSGAAVIINDYYQNEAGYIAASNTDLLQTAFGSYDASSTFEIRSGYAESNARDGNGLNSGSYAYRWNNSNFGIYHLDLAVSPTGYDIGAINFYFGHWGTGRDTITDFDIEYQTVGSSTWTTIVNGGSVDVEDTSGSTTVNWGVVNVVDNSGAALATGVASIRITINSAENNWVTANEVDIIAIPEPSSLLLLGLGGLCMLGHRRR